MSQNVDGRLGYAHFSAVGNTKVDKTMKCEQKAARRRVDYITTAGSFKQLFLSVFAVNVCELWTHLCMCSHEIFYNDLHPLYLLNSESSFIFPFDFRTRSHLYFQNLWLMQMAISQWTDITKHDTHTVRAHISIMLLLVRCLFTEHQLCGAQAIEWACGCFLRWSILSSAYCRGKTSSGACPIFIS